MLSDADNGREQPTPLQLASFFIGRVNPSGREALEREIGSRKGGKRHSKIKRKSKKINRKKSRRRRHRRSYYTERK